MRTFIPILFAALCIGVAMRAPASAAFIPPGSYNDTCTAIQVVGNTLEANCQDISGNWHETQANVSDCQGGLFANNNGTLVCGRGGYRISQQLPRGSWRASCTDGSKNNGILYAKCDTGSGTWRNSNLSLVDCPSRIVDNSYGNLVCRGGMDNTTSSANLQNFSQGSGNYSQGSGNYAMPAGSWRSTCRNAQMQGSMLYAQCYNGAGAWLQASFDMARAPNAVLGNVRGVLVNGNSPDYR